MEGATPQHLLSTFLLLRHLTSRELRRELLGWFGCRALDLGPAAVVPSPARPAEPLPLRPTEAVARRALAAMLRRQPREEEGQGARLGA